MAVQPLLEFQEITPDVSPELLAELREWHPADISEAILYLPPPEIIRFLERLGAPFNVAVFEHLPVETEEACVLETPPARIARLLNEMSSDDRAQLFHRLQPEVQQGLLPLLAKVERDDLAKLLTYEEGTAGSIMTTDFAVLEEEWTVAQSLQSIRLQAPGAETVYYLYVVSKQQVLRGTLSLRELVLARPTLKVTEVMEDEPISVSVTADQEEVARTIAKYDLFAVPVVDEAQVLKGIVTVDDIVDVVEEEATEDIQKLGGMVALDLPYLQTGFGSMIKKRGGWLSALFLGEMLTASAMGHFEDEIARAVVLALFIPLIISSGGNSGSQAATLVIRAMALGEVHLRDWWRIVRREIAAGLALGGFLGVLGFARILVWQEMYHLYGDHSLMVGLTVALSLAGVVLWGTLAGSMLPLAISWARLDPASASAPLVATLVDVSGIIIYFTFAQIFLHGTLL